MDVSENSGTPISSILIGFSIINHPFWGTPILETPLWTSKHHLLVPFPGGRCFIGFSPEDVVDPFGRLESGNGPEPPVGWCGFFLGEKNLQVERINLTPNRGWFLRGFPKIERAVSEILRFMKDAIFIQFFFDSSTISQLPDKQLWSFTHFLFQPFANYCIYYSV